jgi:tetratricopeptide (TPR) repeat protein
LINSRRFDEALTVLTKLESIHTTLGDQHMLGRVQLKRAFALHKTGDFDEEIEVLSRALKLLDPGRDPRCQRVALHNLVVAFISTNRFEEADRQIPELRRLHVAAGERINLLRFRWLEAQLAHAKNDLETAANLYSEVRSAFIDLETGFDVALVSIELAEVHWQQGCPDQAQERLREAIPILKALGIHAEALAAMAFLEHAVRVQTGTRELIRQTAAFIRLVRSEPKTRFRPAALTDA